MAIKKGVNHSNNKKRCSAGNLDALLWKYCKSRYTDFSCSDVHWNFWRMCNALRLGSEVYNWYRLAISPIWRRRSTSVWKKSTVFILHFAPSLRFSLSLQSSFYTQSAVYPWSAVCSLQSAVCVLHWPVSKVSKLQSSNDYPWFQGIISLLKSWSVSHPEVQSMPKASRRSTRTIFSRFQRQSSRVRVEIYAI